jgi:hypothetical protein
MHSLLNSVKWILIIAAFILWFGLSLANRDIFAPLVLIPGVLEFQRVPAALTLVFPFLAAFAVLFVVGLIDQTDHFLTERELRKRIRDLEAEVAQLRNLPIREGLLNQRALDEESRA